MSALSTCAHTIHKQQSHIGWDNSFEPVLRIAPGETVGLETIDSSGGQLGPDSTLEDLAALDFGRVNRDTRHVDHRFGDPVEGAGCLVEYQDRRILEQCPGD